MVWITERLDLLCGLFYLLAILMYLRDVEAESTDAGQSRRFTGRGAGSCLRSSNSCGPLPGFSVLDVYPLRVFD